MSMNDSIAAALSKILNAEKSVKKTVDLKYTSNLLRNVLTKFNELGYIGSFEDVDTEMGPVIRVNLLGNVNKCGAIKPRFPVSVEDILKFEKRYLPSRNVGNILVSTSKGLMTHKSAIEAGIGGILIAFIY